MVKDRINKNPLLVQVDVLGTLTSANAKKIGSPAGQVGNKAIAISGGRTYFTYSISDFLQDVKGGFDDTFSLDVYQTLNAWKKVGFNALPVTINQTHVDYALNGTKDIDHHIGEALLKDLPSAIKNPIAIIQSQSSNHKDRAVVILKMTHNGKNIIGAIEVDGQGITNSISIDSNAMTSLFAKSNALTQLNNAINNTVNGGVELFYWNKKEAITLLQRAGLQLSSSLPQDGFIHSIHDIGSNVKSKFKDITETENGLSRRQPLPGNGAAGESCGDLGDFGEDDGAGIFGQRRSLIRYMGVMLQRDIKSQRLYLHNVVAIETTEEATAFSQDNSLTNWSDEDDRLFTTSILQEAINVKLKKKKLRKKSLRSGTLCPRMTRRRSSRRISGARVPHPPLWRSPFPLGKAQEKDSRGHLSLQGIAKRGRRRRGRRAAERGRSLLLIQMPYFDKFDNKTIENFFELLFKTIVIL